MARNAEIESIFEAWWEFDHCHPAERAKSRTKLNDLLDVAVAKSDRAVTREQIQSWLYSRYKDYASEKKKRDRLAVAQSALKK